MFQMIGVFAELERAVIRESVVSCAVCQLTSFHLEIEELASQSQMVELGKQPHQLTFCSRSSPMDIPQAQQDVRILDSVSGASGKN
jgi:hypothetical protein